MRILRILGTTLSLGFIAILVWRDAGELPRLDMRASATWLWLCTGMIFYMFSQIVGAVAWRSTLGVYEVTLPAGRAESQLLVSQIGKYIPGNVAHLFGRFALARADGVAAGIVGSAMLLEVSVLLGVGLVLSGGLLIVLPEFRTALGQELGEAVVGPATMVFPVLLITALVAGQAILWHKAGRPRIEARRLVMPATLHTTNFAVLGLSLWSVVWAVHPTGGAEPLALLAIFTAAWVVGFLMPGTPGGIGIRDGIVALGLSLFMADGAALGVAVAHRAVATLGDVAIFGTGLTLRRRTDGSPKAPTLR